MKKIILCLLIGLVIFPALKSQDLPKKKYKATRITEAPVINGILDDQVWQLGDWSDDFTQNEPLNGRPASQKTDFKVLFDGDNLYVAIKAYDTSPDSIVNRLTRRDQVDGDLVGILLDSYHDLRTAFLFGVSSSGVKYDQVFINDGQNQDSSWDPNWWVKTSVNKEGWVAEMKIPFSQVRFEKNSGDVWGFEIARIFYRKNETDFWQHIPKDAPGFIHLMGELTGLEQIKPRKIFDVTPYAVAKSETFKPEPGNPFRESGKLSKLNGGIDAKIGVTNNMTMDLTINPDFGQVEADPSLVNLSAYETFYSEKRPFFIEGNNITTFGLGIGDGGIGNDNLFYSRRIGRAPQGSVNLRDGWNADIPSRTTILGAAKLTGKTKDGLSLGFVEAVTAEDRARIDTVGGRTSQIVEPLTNYFVGRVQKDLHEGKTIIGGIFTSTNRDLDPELAKYLHKGAYTGGADFTQYFKNKSWMFNINAAFSYVEGSKSAITQTQLSSAHFFQRPDNKYAKLDTNRTSLLGSGGRMQVMKLNGHWNFLGALLWKTPGFETNDMGYLQQADQLLAIAWAGYNQWEPKGIYRRYNINFDVFNVLDFGGDLLSTGLEGNSNITLKNFWNGWISTSLSGPQRSTSLLRGGPMMKYPGNYRVNMGVNTDNRKKVVFNINVGTNGVYQNSSSSINASIGVDYKPSNYILLSFNPSVSYTHDQLQYVTQTSMGNDARYIFGTISEKTVGASFRVNFNISPDLTLQYWGQPFVATGKYNDYKYITDPMASKYSDRFHTYSPSQIVADNDLFNIYEKGGANPDYQISKSDFNYEAFLSNLVIRWEYNPGSSVYLVWSQTRNSSGANGMMDYVNNVKDLFGVRPTNVFLIKFSYRFGLR